jgi:uncharacterized membrane protein YfcA
MPEASTVFGSVSLFLFTAGVLVLAEVIYLVFGFGAGLFSVGLLALVLPGLEDVIVMLLLVSLPVELWVVASRWEKIQWRKILLISAGILVGVPIGTFLLSWESPGLVLAMLVALLMTVGLAFLVNPRRVSVSWPRWSAPPVGMLSGLLFGLLGAGGPPLVFYYQLQGFDKTTFRDHLIAVFFLVSLLRTSSYSISGLVTAPRLLSALAVFPAVLLGAWLGNRIHLRLSESVFRRLLGIVLLFLGVVLLLRSFWR